MDKVNYYKECRICPRECGVDRTQGESGTCGEYATPRIASIGLHRGEEPPLITKQGSGTLFFTGCSLHCKYCQNWDISQSHSPLGVKFTPSEMANAFLDLQNRGAANINLVTPTHFVPSIIEAIELSRERGLLLPIVYNTSGYEKVETLEMIDSLVDTYLYDIKTLDKTVAQEYCGSSDYPEVVLKTIPFLLEKKKRSYIDDEGFIHGILVRHLIFPDTFKATKEFLHWYAANLKDRAYLSLLIQFLDPFKGRRFATLTKGEYRELLSLLKELGITKGFIPGLEWGSYTIEEAINFL